jgi:hypothetical protein
MNEEVQASSRGPVKKSSGGLKFSGKHLRAGQDMQIVDNSASTQIEIMSRKK